jgi:tetratricopeptide (TPR) repeat protein
MKLSNRLFFATLLLANLISACEGRSLIKPTPSIANTITLQSPLAKNSPTQTRISTGLPTTLQPSPSLSELQSSFLELLNQGKEPSDIIQTLQTPDITVQITPADIDNDNIPELIVTGSINYIYANPESGIWILKRDGTIYQVEYYDHRGITIELKIVAIDDINNNMLQEVILQSFTTSPLGWCEINVFVLGWYEDHIIDYFGGLDTATISCPAEVILGNIVGGNRELQVIGTASNTLGGGPKRGMEATYVFKENKYQLSIVQLAPSNIRIHVLQDAQIAFDNGNYALSLQLWDKAAHDTTLENFSSKRISNDQPQIYQPAYALYRIYCLYLLLGDVQKAQAVFDEIKNRFPENSPGGEFIGVAREIKTLLSTSRDPEMVCPAINNYIYVTYSDELLLDHWDWGYNNQNIVNFCPLLR